MRLIISLRQQTRNNDIT